MKRPGTRLAASILAPVLALLTALAAPLPAAAATSDAATLAAAADKTRSATSYGVSLQLALEGLSAAQADQLGVDPDKPYVAIALGGSFSGEDSHTTLHYGGSVGDAYGGAHGIEMIIVHGQAYIRGPLSSLGANQDRWYKLDDSFSGFTENLIPLRSLAVADTLAVADLSGVKKVGSSQIDGMACTAYQLDSRDTAIDALTGSLSGSGGFEKSRTKNASVKVSACSDGYIHRAEVALDYACTCDTGGVQGAAPRDVPAAYRAAAAPVTFRLTAAYTDIGRPVTIQAPAGAVPLGGEQGGGEVARVANGGNIRATPSLRGQVLGQLHAGETVSLLERTADRRWYRVEAPEATGWVSASLLTLPPGAADRTPVAESAAPSQPAPAPAQPAPSGVTARVFNGGNVRETHSMRGKVLDQINAGESVTMLARTADGWVQIINERGVLGWVHRSLLTVDAATFERLPLAK